MSNLDGVGGWVGCGKGRQEERGVTTYGMGALTFVSSVVVVVVVVHFVGTWQEPQRPAYAQ